MAHLTDSQRKKRNKFVAMLIAIAVVLIALVYVVYTGIMSKSTYLENDELSIALSEIFDERVRAVSEQDLSTVKAVYVYGNEYSGMDTGVLSVGFDKFIAENNAYLQQIEAVEAAQAEEASEEAVEETAGEASEEVVEETTEEATVPEITAVPENHLKSTTLDLDNEAVLNDIKYFTGAEIIEVVGVKITDPEVFNSFTSLKNGTFNSCGITDVSAFASLDLTKIEKLNFTGNDIEDWSALESIADKVIVSTEYGVEMGDDGNYTIVPMDITLAEQLEQEKAAEEAAEETTEEVAEEATKEAVEGTTEESPLAATEATIAE